VTSGLFVGGPVGERFAGMIVHLVRHACAGRKGEWPGSDDDRPLDVAGVAQAAALERALRHTPVGALVSSPLRRCVQTLEPLASHLGRAVTTSGALTPDADADDLVALLLDDAMADAVVCTHGETMQALLPRVEVVAPADGAGLLRKGTAWTLEVDAGSGRIVVADHLVPSGVAHCVDHATAERRAATRAG
jgi:8-oxo-(d)GTP phosphatase